MNVLLLFFTFYLKVLFQGVKKGDHCLTARNCVSSKAILKSNLKQDTVAFISVQNKQATHLISTKSKKYVRKEHIKMHKNTLDQARNKNTENNHCRSLQRS